MKVHEIYYLVPIFKHKYINQINLFLNTSLKDININENHYY